MATAMNSSVKVYSLKEWHPACKGKGAQQADKLASGQQWEPEVAVRMPGHVTVATLGVWWLKAVRSQYG